MPKWVRVRQKATGHQLSLPSPVNRAEYDILNKPALGVGGRPLPPKYFTQKGKQPATIERNVQDAID